MIWGELTPLLSVQHPYYIGGFLKWWYPTTMGFPTNNHHFGVFWGYHHLRKHPYKCPPGLDVCIPTVHRFLLPIAEATSRRKRWNGRKPKQRKPCKWRSGSAEQHLRVFPSMGGSPKMDGENNGKPLLKWMIWGYPYFQKHPFGCFL